MSRNIINVGIGVDDARYHGSALDKNMGKARDLQCRPTVKGLVQQLKKVEEYLGGLQFKLCQEAA